jgi:cyclophilin family peptidyl-prolyl cis-trans isomerase
LLFISAHELSSLKATDFEICLNKKSRVILDMPRSRRFRKSQNQVKAEWGKNNPQTKAKNKKMMIIVGVLAAVVVVLAAVLVFGTGLFAVPSPSPSPNPSATPTSTSGPSPIPSETPTPSATPLTSPTGEYSANGTKVLLTVHWTNSTGQSNTGNIEIQMRDDKPITTTNFVKLVKQGFYDGTVFHRVISNFMIQGGQNQSKTVASIADEIGNDNRNTVGTITMAKTSQPNSATSEFFINVADNSQITYKDGTTFDGTYTVFGQVISGMNVVNSIRQVQVQANPNMGNENSAPVYPATIVSAVILP